MNESLQGNNNHHRSEAQQRYGEVLRTHPGIQVTLNTVREKRTQRKILRESGRTASDHLDSTVEGYIGSGDEKSVFAVDNLAVKIVHDDLSFGTYGFDDQLTHLERAKGIPHLEQIIAHDKEGGVLVTELMFGQPITEIPSLALARAIKPQHIEQLKLTLQAMRDNGIHYDNIGNVLFDKASGFNFLDPQFIYADGATPDTATPETYHSHDINDLEPANFLSVATSLKSFEVSNLLNERGEAQRGFKTRSRLGRLALQQATRRAL